MLSGLITGALNGNLAGSYDIGRVVVVRSAEGAEKFSSALNEYKNKFEAEKQKYLDDLRNLREKIDLELKQ